MILSISWKNIWRTKDRSLIIMTAIALGIFAGIFLIALMQGMTQQRTDAALKTEVSHIQIHTSEYIIDDDFNYFIKDVTPIENDLKNDDRVQGFSKRIIINSQASTAETGTGVTIIGVDPETEINVTDLYTKIKEGEYFKGIKRKPIVISKRLAKKLNAGIKSNIILQIQDTTGSFFPAAFRVAGIYKTSNSAYDANTVFVQNSDLRKYTGLNSNNAHEIAIFMKDKKDIVPFDKELGEKYKNLTVETWKEGNMMLSYMADAMDQYNIIFMLFILAALFFGIINTMLMAILERKRELGMLMAIGMNKVRVFIMIVIETVMLSLTGAVVGIVLGYTVVEYFQKHGIDLSLWAKGLESVGYDPVIYLSIEHSYVYTVVAMVIVTSVLASIFPARRALKLKPVEVLRIDI